MQQPCASSTTPVADPGPVLPAELEQEIFEWAYHLSPASAGNFMLVAHRVHRWIASLVFNVAQQMATPYFPGPSYNPPRRSPKLDYFGEFVKRLIIGGYAHIKDIKKFLNGCPNLIDLALWSHHPTREFLGIFANMSLRKLCTNLTTLKEEDFKGPTFSSITHLDITVFGGDWTRWKVLAHVPRLTHIAINEVVDMKAIHYLLQRCSELRILLVLARDIIVHWNSGGTQVDDPRFVMMTMSRYTLEEWENGAKGNGDIWDCAEAISASKTYGRIKKEHFCTWFSRYEWRKELDELENAA